MDLAYDHIVEESLPKEERGANGQQSGAEQTQNSLNAEIQDAYKAFSASPWGAKIGGFFGTVVKQVCQAMMPTGMGRESFVWVLTRSFLGRFRLPRSAKGTHRPWQRSLAWLHGSV